MGSFAYYSQDHLPNSTWPQIRVSDPGSTRRTGYNQCELLLRKSVFSFKVLTSFKLIHKIVPLKCVHFNLIVFIGNILISIKGNQWQWTFRVGNSSFIHLRYNSCLSFCGHIFSGKKWTYYKFIKNQYDIFLEYRVSISHIQYIQSNSSLVPDPRSMLPTKSPPPTTRARQYPFSKGDGNSRGRGTAPDDPIALVVALCLTSVAPVVRS